MQHPEFTEGELKAIRRLADKAARNEENRRGKLSGREFIPAEGHRDASLFKIESYRRIVGKIDAGLTGDTDSV
jgi:hypothetical protein